MAEEDILFGKKRHLFGGIEPSNMIKFSTILYDNGVVIEAILPKDTIVEGQTLCTVAGAVIRRKLESYPKDEFDGELVMDIVESGTYKDTNADSSATYYYAAYPYTTQGVYNRNITNRSIYMPEGSYYLFGYDLDTSDPDPATRVTYPSDVMNANYTPVSMNQSLKSFSYGSWPSTPGQYFMPRPCMLKNDGTVDHYLNPTDYTERYDLSGSSSVADTSFNGNAMMEWSKIYTYREEIDGVYKFRCSNVKHGPKWECWCNYDKNNNEIDHFYTSIYRASLASQNGAVVNKLRSITGGNDVTITLKQAMEYVAVNGDDWTLETAVDRLLINDLLVMMAKTTNVQTAFGVGKMNTQTVAIGSGNTNGMFYGGTNSIAIKTFGMEDLWGNIPRRCVGWICDGGVQKIKMTRSVRDGSTVDDYNTTGTGYITLEGVNMITSTVYIKNMRTTPFGRIPILENSTVGNSASTYECDGVKFLNELSYPYLGGRSTSSSDDPFMGCFTTMFIPMSNKESYYGFGLSCKPSK